MIYICIIAILIFFILKFDLSSNNGYESKLRNRCEALVYILIISMPIFSYEMGTDTMRYEDWYTNDVYPLQEFSFDDFRYEPLFCLLISLFKTIGLSWFFAHAIIIGFFNYAIFSFGRRYIKPFFTFVLLYFLLHFYEMNFEPIRQSVAMGLFLLAIPALNEGRVTKYLVIVALACGFHISAFLAFLLPILKRINFNIISYIILVLILLIGNYLNTHFSDIIALTGLIGGEDYYELYLKSDLVNNRLNINGIISLLVLKIIPVILSVKMIKSAQAKTFSYLEAACFILTVCMALRAAIPLLDRFVLFWGIIQCGTIANALYIIPLRTDRVVVFVLKFYLWAAFLVNTGMYYMAENEYGFRNYRRFYPYNSIVDKKIDSERRNKQLYIK